MNISLNLILENLSEYGAQLVDSSRTDFTFSGVQILTSPTEALAPDTLYVCAPKVLPRLKKHYLKTTALYSRQDHHKYNATTYCTEFSWTKTPT